MRAAGPGRAGGRHNGSTAARCRRKARERRRAGKDSQWLQHSPGEDSQRLRHSPGKDSPRLRNVESGFGADGPAFWFSSAVRLRCCDKWAASWRDCRGPGEEALKQLLRAGLAADGLIGWFEPLPGDIRPAAETTGGRSSNEKPVIRFPAHIAAARAGTLDAGNQVRIARLDHWPASAAVAGNPEAERRPGRSIRPRSRRLIALVSDVKVGCEIRRSRRRIVVGSEVSEGEMRCG